MSFHDYLIYLSHPSVKMELTEDGWKVKGVLPAKRGQVEEINKKYFKPQKGWSPDMIIGENDRMRLQAFFSEDYPDRLEDLAINISLRPFPNEKVLRSIGETIFQMTRELGLQPFDVYRERFLESVDDIIESLYYVKNKKKLKT